MTIIEHLAQLAVAAVVFGSWYLILVAFWSF